MNGGIELKDKRYYLNEKTKTKLYILIFPFVYKAYKTNGGQ